mmetsp:Transcript_11828/g.43993  ORF Transcript_11828/g.43993 Transcript_11828/m.43993 type:complete len:220 (+) Transcript_11828:140-799(+)
MREFSDVRQAAAIANRPRHGSVRSGVDHHAKRQDQAFRAHRERQSVRVEHERRFFRFGEPAAERHRRRHGRRQGFNIPNRLSHRARAKRALDSSRVSARSRRERVPALHFEIPLGVERPGGYLDSAVRAGRHGGGVFQIPEHDRGGAHRGLVPHEPAQPGTGVGASHPEILRRPRLRDECGWLVRARLVLLPRLWEELGEPGGQLTAPRGVFFGLQLGP